MSLEGAKLICLDEAGNHGDIVLAKGRKFTMGYYVSCDFVLVDERAKGVHCEIECDAFGRVTIRNLSPDTPIVVNGSSVEIKRILFNNSKLSILDKEYLWLFSKNSSNEFEGVPVETSSTPVKYIGIPEQPPNSCPEFKPHRDCPKRFTVHNFAYCIRSDEEGNISLDLSEDVIETKGSNESSPKNIDLVVLENNEGRSVSPQIVNEMAKARNEILDTRTMNIINCSKDKENGSAQKKINQLLAMCHQSEIVITSFSPRETGIKMLKSFATVIKPKGLNTNCPLTPERVYNLPKSDMTVNANDQSMPDLISFYTPSTSKKGMKSAANASTACSQVIKNSSMHLIDLTTPTKLKSSSPHLKSFMKTKNTPKKPSSDEQLDIHELSTAPEISEGSNSCSEVASSSLISVSSSTDISSFVEVTSDSSNIGVTSASATGLNTPLKAQSRTGAFTPKKTPHSLMKRAILTSAKKQNITSHINTQAPNTPSRAITNHKPLGSNLPLLRTPQPSTGNLNKSQLPRRQSMSTPTRKNVPAITRFDNNPSTSKLSPACNSSKTSSRRSSLNPISAGEALTTSTPMSDLRHKSHLRRVLKISGGMPLSNHISKAYRSIPMPSSASNITSVKKRSPQQIMSDRLVTRARNSLNFTPISARSRNMVAASKRITPSTCRSSIIKEFAMQSGSKTEINKQPVDISEVDDLSRTFIIESDEEENIDDKIQRNIPKDATFSPERKLRGIEIPVDVEEVAEIPKENREHQNENVKNINGKNISHLQQDNEVNNATIVGDEKIKSIVTEESFAEVINDAQEQNNVSNNVDNTEKTPGDNHKDANVADPGFGEESTIEMPCSFGEKNIQYNRNGNENCLLIDREDCNRFDLQSTSISKSECDPKKEMDVEINNEKNETVLEENSEEEMKSEHVEGVEFNIKEETQYKPIVEDITLEGSLIQKDKDAQESEGIVEDITFEGSVIEEDKATQKSEQNEEIIFCDQPPYEKPRLEGLQVKEKVQDENTDNEVFSTTSLSKLHHFNMIDELNIEKKDEIPAYNNQSGIIELELRPFNKSEPAEQPQDKQTELQNSSDTSSKEIKNQINSQIFDKNVEEIASKPTDDIKINESESQSATENEARNDGNMEDTNKLLEQIEDVLNKSDEIQQKHLSEVEHSTDMPLTEELETEKFSEEKVTEIEETEVSKKFATEELELKNLSEDKFAEIEKSEKHDKHVSKLLKHQESTDQKVQRNEDFSLQQQQKSDPSMEEKSQASSKKTFEIEISKIQSILTSKEHMEFGDGELKILDNNFSQLKDHACDVVNRKLCVQENFNENAEHIAENIISNKNLSDLGKCESEKTVNKGKNEDNIGKVGILNSKYTVDFNICDKTSTFIAHNDDIEENNKDVRLNKIAKDIPYENFNKNNSVNDTNSDRMFQLHTEDEVIDFVQQEENIEDTNPHNVCFENITADKDPNNDFNSTHTLSDKGLNINIIEIEQNSQRAEVNKAENIIRKEFNAGNKKLDNSKEFTPRRSSRRASQTENPVQPSAELILTPRRSTRRASLSAELAGTLTPSRRIGRRASSVVTETPLTPKSVTKRRISSFVDDDKPSTSKLAKTQTARNQFEKSILIPEEVDEEIDTKEQLSLRKVNFGEKKAQSSILLDDDNSSSAILASKDITLDTQLKETVILPNSIDEDVVVISSEEIELEAEEFDNKHEQLMPEENLENLWQTDLPQTLTELEEHTNTSSSSSTVDWNVNPSLDVVDNSENQNKQEINASSPEKLPEELAKDIDVLISKEKADIHLVLTEMIVIHDSDSEVSQPANEANIKTVISKDNPTAIEDNVDFVMVQECANDDLEKSEIRKAEDFLERKANKSHVEMLSTEITASSKLSANLTTLTTSTVKDAAEFLDNIQKTPRMVGVRELLKTPNTEASTPRFDGISDMMRTPKESLENVEREYEKLADGAVLDETAEPTVSEVPKPKSNNVKRIDDSSKTPLIASSHKLLKTPKTETPQIGGIRDLVLPPKDIGEAILMTSVIEPSTQKLAHTHNLMQIHKSNIDIEQEQYEKSKTNEHIIDDEMPSSSMQNYNLKGVKDLLKTPRNCATPDFQGVRELMKTPKKNSSPTMTDLKQLLEMSTVSETQDNSSEENLVSKQSAEEICSAISEDVINLKGVKELLKTPKRCSTPLFEGIKELMQTPKISSSTALVGIKELMGTTTQPKHYELEKFLRTPAAKNIMIPSMPSSAVIEKSDNSIEVSTEYDLNATNVGEATNLEELFKTPMSSHFGERITASYYSEDVDRQGEIEEQFTELTSVSLQDTLSKTAEEAFDKLVGQETQFQTPIRKQYTRKSITLKTDQSKSPFTAADVLSDLPKTDVEEWIETLEEAEPPTIIDCDDEEVEYEVKEDKINESVNEVGGGVSTRKYSLKQGNISFNESIIPETCAKVYLTENKLGTKNTASSSCTETKDPLTNAAKQIEIVVSKSPDTSCRAEISGINLLDETFETLGSETSMLDEALIVEEPSMFEDALVVSDNESEAECKLNYVGKCGISQYEGNDLSEPLLVSDSEDINNSQQTVSNEIVKTENACEINENNDEDSQTSSNFDVGVQDKSMIDKCSNMAFTMAEDPLETEHEGKSFVNSARKSELKTDYKQISIVTAREDKNFNEYDISQSETKFDGEEISKDNELYSKGENHLTQKNKQSEVCENIEEDIIEVLSGSKIDKTPEDASADQKESSKNPTIIIDSDSEIDAIEVLSNSVQSGNVDIENKKEKQFTSNVSDDIFVDDASASESCKEAKEDQTENKQHPIMTYDECQDIFIDNSDITEENEAVLCNISAKADNENNRNYIAEKEIDICNTAKTSAVVSQCIKENEIFVNEEVLTKQTQGRPPQTNMCESVVIDYNPPIISADLCQATETMYCLPTELPQHIEAQKFSAVESKASEILLTEQESVDANTIEFALNKTNIMPNIADTDIEPTTPLAFENSKETEGELDPETKEIFKKSLIDSSADLTLADKGAPKPIKCSEQGSLETQHDKSGNDVRIQNFKINISQASEKSLKEGDCIPEDIDRQLTGSANSEDQLRVSVENLQPLNEISKDLEKTFESGPTTSTTKYPSIAENYKQHKIIDKELTLEVFESEEIISGEACSVDLTPSAKIIKYDFEIQINDIDDKTKELPTSSKSNKNTDPYYELFASTEPSTVEGISEESTTTLKSLEVSEESAEGKAISTISHQSKVVSEKPEKVENIQVMKQATFFTVQESENSEVKRTPSESSQENFKDNDNSARTCREDRRKVEKSPLKVTILERKECEELIVQQVLEDDITKLEVTSEEISNNLPEINKQVPNTEAKPDDKRHIAGDVFVEAHKKILADENITQGKQSRQIETSAKDVHISEQQKGEEQSESDALTGKLRHVEENEIKQSEGEFLPDIHSPSTSENYNTLGTERHMLTREIITPSKFHGSRDKEQHLSENRIKEDLMSSTASEETTLCDTSKTAAASHNIEKVNEQKILQKPSDDGNKLPNIIEISGQKDGANVKGILPPGGEVYTLVERKKCHIGMRSRRKGGAVSESTKNLVIEDVETFATMSRRKAQKIPVEEDAAEDIKDDEVASTTVTSIESNKANLESGKIANDGKEQEYISSTDDQIIEIQQQTRKRGCGKANVSESSQCSINEIDISRTRSGRRKVTKTPIEKVVLEEKHAGKSRERSIFNKVELEAEQNTFEQKPMPVLVEVTEVAPNEAIVELKYDQTSKPEENSKHQLESKTKEISKGRAENVESKEVISRRGRSKQTSLETVLEEPTTSRKSRRKQKVSNTESKFRMHPDTNKQVEDINVVAIEMPVVEKVSAQQINEEAEIVKFGRHGKAYIKDITTETVPHKEISFPNSSEFIISDTKTLEQNITKELPDEQDKKKDLTHILPVQKTCEKAEQEVEHPTKYSARRLRAVKKQTTNELTELDDSHREETSLKKNQKIDSEFGEKHQKSTRRRKAVADKQYDKHQEELLPKTRKRRIKQDECGNLTEAENLTENSLLSNVKVTDVNIEGPHPSHQLTNDGEKNQEEDKTCRKQPTSEGDEMLNTPKGRAVTKDISEGNKASIPSIKTRVSRRKQIGEKQEAVIQPVAHHESEKKNDKNVVNATKEQQLHETNKIIYEKDQNLCEAASKLTDNSETSSTIDRKQKKYEELQTTHIENSGDTNEETALKGNRDNEQPREGMKTLRSKTKKIDHQKEEAPTISYSHEVKHNINTHKGSHSDIRDTTSNVSIQSDGKLVADSDTTVHISSTNMEYQTPQRKFPVSRKGRKHFEHITAESQEIEDTPGRRARNVPQRRAATAYHNYDETSDGEMSTKALKKTDTPRKYLEAAKKSPTTSTTSPASASISPSPATAALITTARGRTRKPTAKVQQFLEEERAKAETPKRRALLAAAAVAEAVTPQRTLARRGRKPSTIETEVEGISKSYKKSGRAKSSASSIKEKDTNVDSETISAVEKTENQLKVTPIQPNTIKSHRGGRKAKITEEKQQSSHEVPAKKTPLELQNEKLNSPFSTEVVTPPTRVAGKRNAAAAAKARIEEDALAAAAIEPPKRSRGKKAITKLVSTPVSVTTDTDPQRYALEQEHSPKVEKEDKDKGLGESREHRLASVSTVESTEDLQKEIEVETGEKPGNKKRRKAAASVTTNSPAVPVKRSRKAKIIEEVADTNNAGDSQTSRSRGRGRRNVHFNEHHEAAETSSSNQQNASDGTSVPPGDTSEPVKKATRTRRK